jgi:hypothetical protein
VDDRSFVEALMVAVPEAFTDRGVVEDLLGEPLPYTALAHARIWLEDNALRISIVPRRARLRPEHVDVFRRFWDFVEAQALSGKGDGELETLLQIECFEGVGWVEDLSEYVGPSTRDLLHDARARLARYNGQIGRWGGSRRRNPRR